MSSLQSDFGMAVRPRDAAASPTAHARLNGRLGFWFCLTSAAGVPALVVVLLWRNLTLPFWYNEQWRAYYLGLSDHWWSALRADGGPFPAGWFFLERATMALFGSTELAMRLPVAAFLPMTSVFLFLLARRWTPLPAAVLVSLVGTLTGIIVDFAVQLSEYQLDAAAAVLVVLLHEVAADAIPAGWRSWRVYLAYGGIGLACLFSTPALFLAGPLLLIDVLRALRRRSDAVHAAAAIGAGILILLHLGLFVLRQNALTKSSYWDANFMPHRGLVRQIRFLLDGLKGFVSGPFTGYYRPGMHPLLSTHWGWLLTACFAVMLTLGGIRLMASDRGRVLLLAIAGSGALTLLASYLRYWPFGFVRTNYYVVPLLIFIAGVGATSAVAPLRSSDVRGNARRIAATFDGPAKWAVSTVTIVALGFSLMYEIGSLGDIRVSTHRPAYGREIPLAIAAVRAQAGPGAAVVVAGAMATDGWDYYQYEYSGKSVETGPQLPSSRVALVAKHGSPSITALVNVLQPSEIFLYVPVGTTANEVDLDRAAVNKAEACRTLTVRAFPHSGLLLILGCRHGGLAVPPGRPGTVTDYRSQWTVPVER